MKNSIILILFSIISALIINNCADEIVVNGPKNQGKLIIDSNPSGAQIYFMGTNTNKITPDSILGLESGNYEVTLKKEDCCDTTFNVKVYDKLTTSINAKLIKQKTYGNLFIESIPAEAAIYFSGLNTNKTTPDTITKLETGDYQVTLKKVNYLDTTFNVGIFKDSTASYSVQLTQKPPGRGNLFIRSVPNGANIYLSGVDTKKITPDSILKLNEGDYQVILSKENYLDTAFNVTIKDSATTSKIITLQSTKTTGSIFLQSVPNGAQIYISGNNTNKTTPEGISNLEEGNYE
ncbi:MAG: PEGA domain-containing protein, partial [Ignavibacteriaceae bacterium]